MPAKTYISIDGLDDLKRAFKRMGSETRKTRVIKKAGRAGGRVMLNEMRRRARGIGLRTSGNPKNKAFKKLTYKLLKVSAKGSNADDVEITIGPQGREAAKFYWVEYGTVNRKGGRGSIRPRAVVRPAIDKTKNIARDILLLEMYDEVEKEWNRRI